MAVVVVVVAAAAAAVMVRMGVCGACAPAHRATATAARPRIASGSGTWTGSGSGSENGSGSGSGSGKEVALCSDWAPPRAALVCGSSNSVWRRLSSCRGPVVELVLAVGLRLLGSRRLRHLEARVEVLLHYLATWVVRAMIIAWCQSYHS